MNTNGQIFWNHASTPAACLRSISRVHGDHLSTSFFRFVLKHPAQFAQTSIVRGQGQMFVTVHECKGQIFDCDQVIFANEPGTDFMQIVPTLVGDMLVQTADLTVGFTAGLDCL